MKVQSESTARIAQTLISVPFLGMGAWCVLFPGMIERLGLTPEHYIGTPASKVLIGCFGAQAVLSGLFAATTRFTRTTFLAYGVALLPFFWFNYQFAIAVKMFTAFMLLDAVANVAMLVLCVIGWRALRPVAG